MDPSKDEVDLAKALDDVANAASGFGSVTPVVPTDTSTSDDLSTDSTLADLGATNPAVDTTTASDTSAPAPVNGVPDFSDFPTITTTPPITPPESEEDTSLIDQNLSGEPKTSDATIVPGAESVESVEKVEDDKPAEVAGTPIVSTTPDTTDKSEPEDNSELNTIKQQAINELRPLVGKLNVSAEERFDTYLLLIRSTDDTELIAPAHDAAKEIEDEEKRAKALLDIIKEVDYLSHKEDK